MLHIDKVTFKEDHSLLSHFPKDPHQKKADHASMDALGVVVGAVK